MSQTGSSTFPGSTTSSGSPRRTDTWRSGHTPLPLHLPTRCSNSMSSGWRCGEVSTFLADVLEVGDALQVRGPIGGWFVWAGDSPALGIAGGSGAVPLVSMLRHAIDLGHPELLHLVISARTRADLPYPEEILAAGGLIVLSREDMADRPAARLTGAEVASFVWPSGSCLVCGSESFAEAATELLIALGVDARRIRVERFGPTGP